MLRDRKTQQQNEYEIVLLEELVKLQLIKWLIHMDVVHQILFVVLDHQ